MTQAPKNILLLTIDTLRADRLGCYGYDKPITPVLDRLAASGVRFENAITSGSWTQAAFPGILTSSYASTHGGCLGPLAPSRPSPIESLAECGYRTFGFSSSPLLSRKFGYDRGFSDFKDPAPGERDPFLRRMKGGERLLRFPLVHRLFNAFGVQTRPARLYLSADEIETRVEEWLVPGDKAFFGWIHYMDVHWPYHREMDLRSADELAHAWRDIAHLHRVNWKGDSISANQKAHYQDLYENAVAYMDGYIGRLLVILERNGLSDNTIVIIVSDHGEEFLERGKWGHFEVNLHDEIVRVPLIIYHPGMDTGLKVQKQVSTLDIMPTILDLAGCSPPDCMEGVSLASVFEDGRTVHSAETAISEMWREHWHIIGLRTDHFKYIWNSRIPDQPKLYDLESDPHETTDVISRFPEVAAEFRAKISAHLEKGSQTAPVQAMAEPEHNDEMIRRLRDLGYLE